MSRREDPSVESDHEPDTSVGPMPARPERPRSKEGSTRPSLPFETDPGLVAAPLSDKPTPRRADLPDQELPEEHTQATAVNPVFEAPATSPGLVPPLDTSVTSLPGDGEEATGVMDLKAFSGVPAGGSGSAGVPWDTAKNPLPPAVTAAPPKAEPSGVGRRPTGLAIPTQSEPSGPQRRPTSGEVKAPRRPTSAEGLAASDPSITVPMPRRSTGEGPLPARKGTRGEIPVQSEPSVARKGTRGEIPVQSEPSLPGARKGTRGEIPVQSEPSVSTPRKGTRGEIPVQNEPSVARKGTRGEIPVQSEPPARKGTRGEIPVQSEPSVARKGTRGEIPVQSEPSVATPRKGTRGEIPVQSEPSQAGVRKPTRGEIPVQNEPSVARKGTRGEIPVQSEPAARKGTRGEIPVQAEKAKPAPPVDEEDEGTSPIDRREMERLNEERGRPKRQMLSEQLTGEVVLSQFQSKPEPRFEGATRARPEDVAEEPTSSVVTAAPLSHEPTPMKGGRAKGALNKLSEMTGLHKLKSLTSAGLTGIHSLSTLNKLPGRKLGFQVVLGGAMVLGGVGLTIHMFTRTDLPNVEQLQVLYPYGFAGGTQPNGRSAPSATEVSYTFQETVECGASLCQKYEVTGRDGVFRMTMTVTKDETGSWSRVGDAPR